jgi:hypothetical protein
VAIEGSPISSQRLFYLVPKGPLVAGKRYRLQFAQTCTSQQPASGIGTAEQTFTAGPSSDLPRTIGTVKGVSHRIGPRTVSSINPPGQCFPTAQVTAAISRIEIDPSPELRALLATTRLQLRRGSDEVATLAQPNPAAGAPLVFEVHSTCASSDPGADRGLPAGTHRLTVHASTWGVMVPPEPLAVDVSLDCGAASDGGVAEDGGSGRAEAGVDAGAGDAGAADAGGADAGTSPDAARLDGGTPPTADAGSSADQGAPPTTTGKSGGCAVAGVAAPTGAGWIVAFALLAAGRRLSRGRRSGARG